jgi:hypothetical protein
VVGKGTEGFIPGVFVPDVWGGFPRPPVEGEIWVHPVMIRKIPAIIRIEGSILIGNLLSYFVYSGPADF